MKKNWSRCLALAMACFMPVFTVGCTKADIDKTVALIGAELPTAIQLALQVATIVAAFGTSGPSVQTTNQKVVAGLQELETLVTAYQAHPSADVYTQITQTINDVVTNSEAQLLAASQIEDVKSKQEAVTLLGSLNAVLLIIDGYVQATQSTKQVQATAATRKAKLSRMQSMLNIPMMDQKLHQHGYTYKQYYTHETAMGF